MLYIKFYFQDFKNDTLNVIIDQLDIEFQKRMRRENQEDEIAVVEEEEKSDEERFRILMRYLTMDNRLDNIESAIQFEEKAAIVYNVRAIFFQFSISFLVIYFLIIFVCVLEYAFIRWSCHRSGSFEILRFDSPFTTYGRKRRSI